MRIAAIDIGTNSVHMIVAQVRPDLSFEVIDREKDMVRLGAGGLGGRALTAAATTAALQTLAKFKRLADSHLVDEILVSATSAVREAENGGDFLAALERQAGLHAKVISGIEEARLIHQAAAYGVDIGSSPVVVIDIGGGSVEITHGDATGPRLARSFKLGVIRLGERFVRSDPLSDRDQRRLVRHVNQEIASHIRDILARGFERVIGTSGTILSLGALASIESHPEGAEELRNRRVAAKQIHRIRKRLVSLTIEQRLELPGLDPRRADLAVGGAVLLDTILRRLGARELTLCDLALREGLILDYIRKNRAQIAKVDRYPDVRRRSVIELAERCNYSPRHSRQVVQLALALFDQTQPLHRLRSRDRELLEYAALLHDVGVHISHGRHHKHSYYLIKNGDLRGFEPHETEIVALVARYHRRGTPKKSHDGYGALGPETRRAVRVLSAILRLAEGLDRSHSRLVTSLRLQDRGDAYVLRLRARGDVELELWAGLRHAAPLEKILGKPLRLVVGGATHARHAKDTSSVSRQAVRRRGHRRLRQDDAAGPGRQVVERRRPSGLSH